MIRSQSTAAAALNTRLEEDMEAIRQVNIIEAIMLLMILTLLMLLILVMLLVVGVITW